MWSFLAEFARRASGPYRVILMDEECREQPRHYSVHPQHVALVAAGAVLMATTLLVALIVLTPLRELIPGYGTAALRQDARLASVRLASLEDSLAAQQAYVEQLRQLFTTGSDPSAATPEATPALVGAAAETPLDASEDWADHEQPALPIAQLPAAPVAAPRPEASARYLSSLQLPAVPPVGGLLTSGFDPRAGHFAIDIATEEGSLVRSIGDGYVILADWTHEGGYAVAVQHSDGFVSVYKHNQRLLKRVGDRVRARDAIAASGNSGEYTTGPHLHFELWHNGLAQDPQVYLVGL